MCGIAGYIGDINFIPKNQRIKKCEKLMGFRGPDDFNSELLKENSRAHLLLHSRLAIIDFNKRSNQPIEDDNGILVFNGMIYNYLELKEKLKKKINFKTKSDTEVLLKYLNLYGKDCLNKLEGMWAFYYYNKKTKLSILSRDRFGEKPLYYKKEKKKFYFGSSINYIGALSSKKLSINYKKIQDGLSYGYKTFYNENKTFFKDIFSLEPGTSIIIEKNKKISFFKYFNKKIEIKKINYKKTKSKLEKILSKDFSKAIRSDFPVACLLSGGIDSNIIAAYSKKFVNKKFECFSIKNQDTNYDESININKAIRKLNVKHNYVKFKKENSLKYLDRFIKNTSSIMPTATWMLYSQIIKKIKSKGFKVVLGGAGGDELFAGYYIHNLYYLKSILNKKKLFKDYYAEWNAKVRPLIRSKYLNDFKFFLKNSNKINSNLTPFLENEEFLKKKNHKMFINKKFIKNDLKNFLYYEIFYSSLPAQLNPADNISMYHGIENRSPILTKDIYNISFQSKNEYFLNNGFGKYLLRDISTSYIDNQISWSRNKIGFYSDLKNIFDIDSKSFRQKLFQSKKINSYLDKQKIINLLDSGKKLSNSQSHFLFSILNFSILDKYYG